MTMSFDTLTLTADSTSTRGDALLSVASSHDLSQMLPSDSSEVVDWSIIMDVEDDACI